MTDTLPTIPQAMLDHYQACYNNQTYTTFRTALAKALGLDEAVTRFETHDERHQGIMNLLIDTALELLGSEVYAGAGQQLGSALGGLEGHTPALVRLAVEHLKRFVVGEHVREARQKIAHMAALALAESARRVLVQALDHAAQLPGWQGIVPYEWLLACTQLIRSADIVLRADPSATYLDEKFSTAIEWLACGAGEMARHGSPPPSIRQFHERMTAGSDQDPA